MINGKKDSTSIDQSKFWQEKLKEPIVRCVK